MQKNVEKRQRIGLSKSELLQIRDELVNIKGRSRTVEENKLLIQFIAYELILDNSENEIYRKCQDVFGGSYETYQNTWRNYVENKSSSPEYCARELYQQSYYIMM